MDFRRDSRIILTLDAGGTNSVFSALQGAEEIIEPISVPSEAQDLSRCRMAGATGSENSEAGKTCFVADSTVLPGKK